jgi:GNAT superfamily N-acetyltransferase
MIPHWLDNPAWSALCSVQAGFAVGNDCAKRYRKGVLPFAALSPGTHASQLDSIIEAGESFYLIGDLPELPKNYILQTNLPCAQLLGPEYIGDLPPVTEQIVCLGEQDKMEMFDLINSVQPGYYLPDTRQLGCYFGIRVKGKLVAMAGERMQMTGLSEISAVCTLPGFTGRGFAQQLMTRVIQEIENRAVAPYLHVSKANTRALRLYEHLGFRHRRDISFYRIGKITD